MAEATQTTTPPPATLPVPAAVTSPPKPVEPAKPEVASPKEDDRIAQLIAKESALVKQQQELKAQREAFAKTQNELAELKALLSDAKRNPESVAKKLWGDQYYEQFTEMRLSGSKVTPDLIAQSVDEKLEAYKKEQAAAREAELAQERERLAAEQQRVVTAWREDIREYVKSHGEEYELINLHGWHDQVVRTIEDHFAKTQRIMSTNEAASLVEKQIEEAIQKSLGTKKFTQRPAEPDKRIESAQPRTLTNALTASTAPTPEQPLSEEERILRAIAKGREVASRRGA